MLFSYLCTRQDSFGQCFLLTSMRSPAHTSSSQGAFTSQYWDSPCKLIVSSLEALALAAWSHGQDLLLGDIGSEQSLAHSDLTRWRFMVSLHISSWPYWDIQRWLPILPSWIIKTLCKAVTANNFTILTLAEPCVPDQQAGRCADNSGHSSLLCRMAVTCVLSQMIL